MFAKMVLGFMPAMRICRYGWRFDSMQRRVRSIRKRLHADNPRISGTHGAGARCNGGSKVNIQNANLLGVGGLVADVGGGGLVYLHGTSGNTSIPVNTFTAAGLIWGDDPTP